MSWTFSKSGSLSTDSLHYQCISMLWTSSKNCSLSTASLRYQCLSMSWTSSKNCSLLTYTINVLDKLTELFPPNLHFQFLGQRFIEFFLSTASWTSSKNCFLSTTSLHYQYLGHIHRIVFFQQLPYTVNILDTFIELFSFNIFLTLSISWTHHRTVFFQQLPYTVNILDTSIELFSFNSFLTLSISWTHP